MNLRRTSIYTALAGAFLAALPLVPAQAGNVRLVFNNSARPIGISHQALIRYLPHSNDRLVELRLSEPLLCAEFPSGANTHVRLRFVDANNDVLANNAAGFAANTFGGLTTISGNTGGIRYNTDGADTELLQLNVNNNELTCQLFETFVLPTVADGAGKNATVTGGGYRLAAYTGGLQPKGATDTIFVNGFEQGFASPLDVQTTISAPATVRAGQPYAYTITVRNNGSNPVSGVQVRDFFFKAGARPVGNTTLPVLGNGTWSCAAGSGGNCGSSTSGTGVIFASGISLASGGQVSFSASRPVDASSGTGLSFSVAATAFVDPDLAETALANNAATASTQIVVTQPPVISNLPVSPSILEDNSGGPYAFTLSDPDTALSAITVTATSDNQGVIANSGISVSGSGENRTFSVTPVTNANGAATITLVANDGTGNTDTKTVTFNVTAVNDAPDFSWKPNCAASNGGSWNSASAPAQFTYPAGSSNNQNCSDFVVPTFGPGNESGQALSVIEIVSVDNPGLFAEQPVLDVKNLLSFRPNGSSGTANVQVRIRDNGGTAGGGINLSPNHTFRVRVEGAAPTLTAIASQSINEDASTGALAFTLGDTDTPVGNLTVTASSSNPTLLPPGSLQLGGSGASRSISVTPATNEFGSATVTLTVSDGDQQAQRTFDVNVAPVNDAPSFNSLGDQLFPSLQPSGLRQINGWASNVSVGPANEAAPPQNQVPDQFIVERLDSNLPNIISTEPTVSIAAGGRLSFSLRSTGGITLDGYACYRVSLLDSGDGTPPNDNQSNEVLLKIQVGPGNFSCEGLAAERAARDAAKAKGR